MLDWLKALDLATGLLASAVGGIAAVAVWVWRERKGISAEIADSHDKLSAQIERLDGEVREVEDRVGRSATQEDIRSIREQVMGTSVTLARIEGQIARQAERDQALTEHLNNLNQRVGMIYEAMLRKEPKT